MLNQYHLTLPSFPERANAGDASRLQRRRSKFDAARRRASESGASRCEPDGVALLYHPEQDGQYSRLFTSLDVVPEEMTFRNG